MPSVADVVQLTDGSVGVISDLLPQNQFRVQFPNGTRIDTFAPDIVNTLAAPSYNPGDEVYVWPEYGTIQSISGDKIVVRVNRQTFLLNIGISIWTSDDTIPLWRIILDNDSRLAREYR